MQDPEEVSSVDGKSGGLTNTPQRLEDQYLKPEQGKRFVFQWYPDSGNPKLATTIEIDFGAFEEGTVVRVREYGHENAPTSLAALAECAAGWGEAITLLKFYVEHGIK
ncbi:MAG: SRPBCC domain-containing protein [Candidatus Thorarchaeota archaeon]